MLVNGQPQGWTGLLAANVTLEEFDSVGVTVTNFTDPEGDAGCSLSDGRLRCSPGTLAPGADQTVNIIVAPQQAAIYDSIEIPFALRAQTSSATLQDEYIATRLLRFDADHTDSDQDGMNDRFEETYGLNKLAAADASADLDNDGSLNSEEFNARTDPTNSDTDGDGVSDGFDEFPLDPSQTGEFLSGDLNGDGKVDAADILLLQRALQGQEPKAGLTQSSDINNDGELDVRDWLLLQQMAGGQ